MLISFNYCEVANEGAHTQIQYGMQVKHTPKASGVVLVCHLIYCHLPHMPQRAPPESRAENQPFVHIACS